MENVMLPIRTLHGMNADKLREDYIEAMSVVENAKQRFMQIEFNARDYADFESFCKAKEQMIDAYSKLDDVCIYLETIAASIK
jgi:hypothetical protein